MQGKHIDFSPDFKISKSLRLVPDLDTLREQPWRNKEALVLADVYGMDNDEPLKYAPRNLMK